MTPHRILFGVILFAAAMIASPARAQPYPSKPVTILVGFAHNGAADIVARTIQPFLQGKLGQPITIENKPGSGGAFGNQAIARAAPDGYTFMLATSGQLLNTPLLTKAASPDVEREIMPVALAAGSPFVLVVPGASQFQTLDQFLAFGRANPGQLDFVSFGPGSGQHMAAEMLNVLAGLKAGHKPYRSSGPAVIDLISGKVQFMMDNISVVRSHTASGALRALAVTGLEPDPAFADVPAIAERVPDMVFTSWYGFVAPKETPPEIVAVFSRAVEAMARDPDFDARMKELGSNAAYADSAAFGRNLAAERIRIRRVIETGNFKVQ